MKKVSALLAAAGALSLLAGCKEAKVPEAAVVQTVDWYKAHEAERTAMLQLCNANPGQLAATPNCVNAGRAQSSITWGAKGGMKAPKPLTAEDFKKK